ncbi:MAG: chromate transporter [Bacteroidales bacterium]|jgi:chromate transporter|nr:chromate transporter [Bacteroidales bacterium]
MIILRLFLIFCKIGIFTFGGGYSMVALIQNEVVEKYHWLTAEEFTDLLAVSQMTPGPVGINTATYTGYTVVLNNGGEPWMGIVGSLVASFAVILLPFIAMLLLCRFLAKHRDNPIIDIIFRVLRLTVVGLIAAAAISLASVENFGSWDISHKQVIISVALFVAVFVASFKFKKSPIMLLLASGAVGFLAYYVF